MDPERGHSVGRPRHLDRLGSEGDDLCRRPAARVSSVAEASRDSWIGSRNASAPNTRVDHYGKGALVSLCLDMEVRVRTGNLGDRRHGAWQAAAVAR